MALATVVELLALGQLAILVEPAMEAVGQVALAAEPAAEPTALE